MAVIMIVLVILLIVGWTISTIWAATSEPKAPTFFWALLPIGAVSLTVILAGVMILCIGLYYAVIKAGIPYQDPPLELEIKYAVNAGIGDELTKDGFWIALLGCVMRICIGLVLKRKGNA